jgi:serine/threonine protein kinase
MKQLGKYRIEAKLGEGAMGFVYKAWNPGFNDYVALKTIQDTRLESRELVERFNLEVQALFKLKHQNIVQIYEAGQVDGVHFIVMEYMNGGSLDRIITNRETVPLAKRVGYLIPVCHALEFAHKKRIFHRDIKPANIMLHVDEVEEIIKVVDFGIARLVDSSHTQTKVRIGSPYYMAPELINATAKANERTDIWALGVTLYELISYQRPFEGKEEDELYRNIVRALHKPLTQIVPDCPKDLSAVVEKTLEKDPSSRYQTVEDLLIDLEPIAKRLKTDVAGNLVRRAKDLLEMGEFESAKSALKDVENSHCESVKPIPIKLN